MRSLSGMFTGTINDRGGFFSWMAGFKKRTKERIIMSRWNYLKSTSAERFRFYIFLFSPDWSYYFFALDLKLQVYFLFPDSGKLKKIRFPSWFVSIAEDAPLRRKKKEKMEHFSRLGKNLRNPREGSNRGKEGSQGVFLGDQSHQLFVVRGRFGKH